MKNLSKLQQLLVQNVIAFLPIILLVLFKKGVLINDKNAGMYFYLGYLIVFSIMSIYSIFQEKANSRGLILESIYTCIAGCAFCFDSIFDNFNNELLIAFCVCLHFMYQGNKQALIPQDAPNAGLMKDYDEKAYKKSQRMWGRLQFGFGFVALITFLIIPTQFYFHAFIVFYVVFFTSILIWLYKSSKATI